MFGMKFELGIARVLTRSSKNQSTATFGADVFMKYDFPYTYLDNFLLYVT